jgi:hypothetical protein
MVPMVDATRTAGAPIRLLVTVLLLTVSTACDLGEGDGASPETSGTSTTGSTTPTSTTPSSTTTATPTPTPTATPTADPTTPTEATPPTTASCPIVVFTPNSGDGAFRVRATGLSCDAAESLLRDIDAAAGSPPPPTITVSGWTCTSTRIPDPAGALVHDWDCRKNDHRVTWQRG